MRMLASIRTHYNIDFPKTQLLFEISFKIFSPFYNIKRNNPRQSDIVSNEGDAARTEKHRNGNRAVFFDFINGYSHQINQDQISGNHCEIENGNLDYPANGCRELAFEHGFDYRIITEEGNIHHRNLLVGNEQEGENGNGGENTESPFFIDLHNDENDEDARNCGEGIGQKRNYRNGYHQHQRQSGNDSADGAL